MTQPAVPPDCATEPIPLIVLVAPTAQVRDELLAHLDPSAPVLIVPSVSAAQDVMGSALTGPAGAAPDEEGTGLPRPGAPGEVPPGQPSEDQQRAARGSWAAAEPQGAEPGADRQPAMDGPAALLRGVAVKEDRHAIEFGSVEVSLTPLEFALLGLLLREPGRVWRYAELVQRVWDTEHLGDTSQVHALVKRLRAKLAREHAPVVIEAVRGVGFRAVRPPRRGMLADPTLG